MLYQQKTKSEGGLERERQSDLLFIYTPIECHTTFKSLWSDKKKKNPSGKERLITVQSRKREEKKKL